MIFYGSKGTLLATEPVLGVRCPNCGNGSSLSATIYGRYAHVYWIPLFPFSKVALLSCESCQRAWEEKNLPEAAIAPVREAKQNASHRRWEWAGLVLVLGLSVYITVAGVRDNRQDDGFLAAPRAGDIYTVRSDSAKGMYTLLKVQAVRADTVEFLQNKYEISSSIPITKLKDDEYSPDTLLLSRPALLEMRRKGQLTDVSRP